MENFLGYNLKIARLSLRLSPKDLACKLGVTRQIIYDYEKNNRTPSFEMIRKLSIILDKPHLYFFTRLDNHFTKDNPIFFFAIAND